MTINEINKNLPDNYLLQETKEDDMFVVTHEYKTGQYNHVSSYEYIPHISEIIFDIIQHTDHQRYLKEKEAYEAIKYWVVSFYIGGDKAEKIYKGVTKEDAIYKFQCDMRTLGFPSTITPEVTEAAFGPALNLFFLMKL